MSTTWIVTPVFHDTQNLIILREQVLKELEGVRSKWPQVGVPHFVVIDDCAGQDAEIYKLNGMKDVTVLTPPFNLGHQRAIVYGVRSIPNIGDRDIVITMDSDGEDRPEDIAKLIEPLMIGADPNLLSIAQRTTRKETWSFKLGYFVYKIVFRILTGTLIRTGNFAAYYGFLSKKILSHPNFELCYSSTLVSIPLKSVFVGCPRGSRYSGQSKMNFTRLVMHGMRMLMPHLDKIAVRSLIFFASVLMVGIVSGFAVLGTRLFTDYAIPGWATYTLLLVCMVSFVAFSNFVILFMLFSQTSGISLNGIQGTFSQSKKTKLEAS